MDQIQDDREGSTEEPPYWLKPRIWLTKTLELVIAVVLFLWLPAAIVVSRVYKWVRSLLPWKRRRIVKDNVVVITGASSGIGEVRNSVLQFHQTAQVQFWIIPIVWYENLFNYCLMRAICIDGQFSQSYTEVRNSASHLPDSESFDPRRGKCPEDAHTHCEIVYVALSISINSTLAHCRV
jgi:hypothetical protein